jgi:hypothetical protein
LHKLSGIGEFLFVLERIVWWSTTYLFGTHELWFVILNIGRLILLQNNARESLGKGDLSCLRLGFH